MEIQETEPNLHQMLHQKRLHLEELFLVLVERQIVSAITIRQEEKNFPDVVTDMIKFFTFHVYALLDPGKSLSFVTPYVANKF